MKKIILSLSVICLMTASCKKDLTDFNNDPKNPKNVPSYTLFSNAQRTLTNTITSSNVNLNIWRLILQYWQETTYTDESNYDLGTRSIPDNIWNAFYRDVLKDFDESARLIPGDVPDPNQRDNELAIIEIMEVYTWYYLVTTYGNIPYSEALDIDKPFPVYDDAATIYTDLLSRIDAAKAMLDPAHPSFGGADLIYGGDVNAWIKFANSLKLKMAMTIADVADVKSIVEAAVTAGVFTSNADNAEFVYQSGPPNTNPIWVDLVQSGRKDFVAASTIVDKMETLGDPRLDDFFTLDNDAGYSGGTPGASSNYATFSKPDERILIANFPALLLDYSEVEFLLAEAVERGFAVGGTAEEHYNKAVTASVIYWGGTTVEATAYLAQPSVNYATAAGTYKQKIGQQKYIALYNRGLDAWTEWRRLDYPQLTAPADAFSDVPLRYYYPVNEQNVNTANYDLASIAIGGDDVETALWWDIF
ncbi:MAG TPA: SusD/RagB family nutrient-binding outer membrane lipoprotein [Chitinophagaceae bacterium]|nr:SusD/RagB family nutrient-binding outer membrane lipoprotein [Chitinophagaceae bacterium]